ncbi:MAG: YceI family protein [Pseudomonadota bacterium]
MKILSATVAALVAVSSPVLAESWSLEGDASTVAFGSIKNDYTGEAHTFKDISGTVDEAGKVTVDINLASVETFIDIRNERMIANVFGDAAKATVTAEIDLAALNALAVGESMTFEADATLNLLGVENPLFLTMFVLRLAEDRVLASTDVPAFIATEDLQIDAGIDALQQIAELDSITRVVPLTARFVFTKD